MPSYTKQTWNNDDPDTPLSAERLNHMEDGIDGASSGGGGAAVILPWATATAYVAGQLVTNGGFTYIANDDHTSGATFTGDKAAHWTALPGTGAPGAWVALGASLNPKWATPVNSSVTDLSDPFCPRYYIDRGRVYLGGVVLLDNTISSTSNRSFIVPTLPAEARPSRDQHFRVVEDTYFSSVGWGGDILTVPGPPPSTTGLVLTASATTSPTTGVAISLDAISYRL